jgi:U2-associated protein SR140
LFDLGQPWDDLHLKPRQKHGLNASRIQSGRALTSILPQAIAASTIQVKFYRKLDSLTNKMAGDEESNPFPNMAHKLNAPKKMSEMERNKRAAEEKQKKEEALQAATLREFEESFGVAPPSRQSQFNDRYPPSGPGHAESGFRGGPSGPSSYDGGLTAPRRSGPGSLEGFAAPPISIQERKRRRAMEEDEAALAREADGYSAGSKAGSDMPNRRKDRDAMTAPKNSVRLSNLPPSITEHQIKNLLRGHLQVYSIDITEQPNVHGVGRRSMTAVVVLDTGTTTTAIEKATSVLKDRYLGCGYSLTISRYLPSDVLFPGMPDDSFVPIDLPFGARPNKQNFPGVSMGSLSRAPPPSDFAPPGTYDQGPLSGNSFRTPADAVVQVRVPKDLQVTQLIHLMASWYHSQEDMNLAMEKESQLMAAPQVQNNPLFAFLFDSNGEAGIYFRWLLWNPQGLSALGGHKRLDSTPVQIFDDVPIDWIPPTIHMPFSDVAEISEILDHLDFESDEELDDDMPGYRDEDPIPGDEDKLGPLRRARLARMLACLPPSRAFLERRHVAPIQNFVMKHAGRGALEIVDIIQMNINRPFNTSGFSIAVPPPGDSDSDDEAMQQDHPTNGQDQDSAPPITAQTYDPATRTPALADLLTDSKLVSLDIVTAVCVASYHAATPGSHRYRKLFPEAFLEAGVIVGLAETPAEHGWGMIKTDRWERRIRAVFKVWEECNCFTLDEIMGFRRIFDGVVSARHKKTTAAEEQGEKLTDVAAKPIFKSVEDVMAEREAMDTGNDEVRDMISDDDDENTGDDEHEREVDGVSIDLTRLKVVKDVSGVLTLHLVDSSSGKVEAVYQPVFEEQHQKREEPEVEMTVAESAPAPAADAAAEPGVPSQSKGASSKEDATPAAQLPVPAPKEKKDIDMFADDDSE